MTLDIRPLRGGDLARALGDLAALRIRVFRDWPYLYDGDLGYERRYLKRFAASAEAVMIGAYDGGRLVGASTAAPMEDHATDFAAPLAQAGLDPAQVWYLAESVLLPDYRGHGAGHRFFDLREAAGRALGRVHAVFCSVLRPADHPQRSPGYRPLDAFWRARGYAPIPGAIAHFSWKDIGASAETSKPLQLWSRSL